MCFAIPALGLTTGAATASVSMAAAATGLSAYSASKASSARSAQARYQAAVQKNNETIANWKADDAIDRGRKEKARHQIKVKNFMGKQTSILAGQGFELDEDAIDILSDTAELGALDARTIESNSQREAWQQRIAASNASAQSQLLTTQAGAESPFLAGATALFGGASSVADKWYNFTK